MDTMGKVTAIVLAAGRGRRMHSEVPKQFMELCGKPVIYYSLKAFEDSKVDEVIMVTGENDIEYCRINIVERFGLRKVHRIIAGGAERFDSVTCGLRACENTQIVLIHDGARPMITPALIEANIHCAASCGACVTAVPSKDTVKIADEDGYVTATPDRSRVWIVQTPQSFRYDIAMSAYEAREMADDASVTDDAMVVEKYLNRRVKLLMGDYRNIKLTTPEDIATLESWLGKAN